MDTQTDYQAYADYCHTTHTAGLFLSFLGIDGWKSAFSQARPSQRFTRESEWVIGSLVRRVRWIQARKCLPAVVWHVAAAGGKTEAGRGRVCQPAGSERGVDGICRDAAARLDVYTEEEVKISQTGHYKSLKRDQQVELWREERNAVCTDLFTVRAVWVIHNSLMFKHQPKRLKHGCLHHSYVSFVSDIHELKCIQILISCPVYILSYFVWSIFIMTLWYSLVAKHHLTHSGIIVRYQRFLHFVKITIFYI